MNQTHSKHRFNPHMLTAALTLLFSLSISVHSAEVYKWVDKDGHTHYSDIKPRNTPTKNMNIRTQKIEQTRKSAQEQAETLNQQQAKSLEAQSQTKQEENKKKELNLKCQAIKSNLKTLLENSRVRIQENGKLRHLSPEEIETKKSKFQQQITEFCS